MSETLTLIASASIAVQWLCYRERLPKDFKPKRILVVKLDHLGDVLLATPVFSNLRRAYPNAELHALTGTWSRVVLEKHPDVNKVLEYNSPTFCRTGQPTPIKRNVPALPAVTSSKIRSFGGTPRRLAYRLFPISAIAGYTELHALTGTGVALF